MKKMGLQKKEFKERKSISSNIHITESTIFLKVLSTTILINYYIMYYILFLKNKSPKIKTTMYTVLTIILASIK